MLDQPHAVEQLAVLPEQDMTSHGRVVAFCGRFEVHEVEWNLTGLRGLLLVPPRHDDAR